MEGLNVDVNEGDYLGQAGEAKGTRLGKLMDNGIDCTTPNTFIGVGINSQGPDQHRTTVAGTVATNPALCDGGDCSTKPAVVLVYVAPVAKAASSTCAGWTHMPTVFKGEKAADGSPFGDPQQREAFFDGGVEARSRERGRGGAS